MANVSISAKIEVATDAVRDTTKPNKTESQNDLKIDTTDAAMCYDTTNNDTDDTMVVASDTENSIGHADVPVSLLTLKGRTPSVADWIAKQKEEQTVKTTNTKTILLGKASTDNFKNKNVTNLQSEACEFMRGGKCRTHGFQGKKGFKVDRKWELRKCGTYGMICRRKTIWTSQCHKISASLELELTQQGDISLNEIESSGSSGGLQGISLHISGGIRDTGGTKRTFSEINSSS